MKVIAKAIPVVVLSIVALNLCHAQENNAIGSDCDIPNQRKTKGICVQVNNCSEYSELFNVVDLTVERLSFIIRLDCGFDHDIWKTLVCCPKPGNTYK